MTLGELSYKGLIGYFVEKNQIPNGIWIYIAAFVVAAIAAYLLGSLNFAVIISKQKFHDDVRQHGSGNAGMTNMMRTYGTKAAVVTFAGDGMKSLLSAGIGFLLCGTYGAYLAGLCCIIGHAYPCFFGFKGGKGVVVTAVLVLCLNPLVFLFLLILFFAILLSTKYVSLSSIICMMLYPILLSNVQSVQGIGTVNGRDLSVLFSVMIAFFVIFLHRSNIKRLYEGNENKFYFKKSKKPVQTPATEETENGAEQTQKLPAQKNKSKKSK